MTDPAVDLYRDYLSSAERDEFPIHAVDRLGVPVWTATLWERGHALHGTGYGATDDEALRGALGELAESKAVADALRDVPTEVASLREARATYGERAVVDPRELILPAGSEWTLDTPVRWVRGARRAVTGDEVLVPVEAAATCFADVPHIGGPWLFTPITNGLGAGDTRARALSHGLMELLQRDGNTARYRALDTGVRVDVDRVASVRPLLDRLRAAGVDPVVKAGSTEFGLANVYCVAPDPRAAHPLMVTSAGEASHPDREHAIRKAVLEWASSRSRKAFTMSGLDALQGLAPERYRRNVEAAEVDVEESRALEAMLDWLRQDADDLGRMLEPTFHRVDRTIDATELPHTPGLQDPEALLGDLLGRLEAFDVLELPLAGGEQGVWAVKAIVPGLEVETMSYLRVGPRVLRDLLDRDVPWVALGDAAPSSFGRPLELPLPEAAAAELGRAWVDGAQVERVVDGHYPLYREPDRHVAGKVLAASA